MTAIVANSMDKDAAVAVTLFFIHNELHMEQTSCLAAFVI